MCLDGGGGQLSLPGNLFNGFSLFDQGIGDFVACSFFEFRPFFSFTSAFSFAEFWILVGCLLCLFPQLASAFDQCAVSFLASFNVPAPQDAAGQVFGLFQFSPGDDELLVNFTQGVPLSFCSGKLFHFCQVDQELLQLLLHENGIVVASLSDTLKQHLRIVFLKQSLQLPAEGGCIPCLIS